MSEYLVTHHRWAAATFADLRDACDVKQDYLDRLRGNSADRMVSVVFSAKLDGYIIMISYGSGYPSRVLARRKP